MEPWAAQLTRAGAFPGERDPYPALAERKANLGTPRPACGAGCQLTRVRLLGELLALASDDEHEHQKQDEDEADQGNDHQEPPLLVERAGLLGWDTDGGVRSRGLSPFPPPDLPLQLGPHHWLSGYGQEASVPSEGGRT